MAEVLLKKEQKMKKSRFSKEQINGILGEAEAGSPVKAVPLLPTVLVAVDTLFPDPADRFLDIGDASGGCDLGLKNALSSAIEVKTRLQFARDEAG
jgi:hypothetical protein